MYCSSSALFTKISYTPAITTGSIAALPTAKASKTPPSTSQTSQVANSTSGMMPPASSHSAHSPSTPAIAQDNAQGIARDTVAGIAVGVGAGVALIIAVLLLCKRRRKCIKTGEIVTSQQPTSRRTDGQVNSGLEERCAAGTERTSPETRIPSGLKEGSSSPIQQSSFISPMVGLNARMEAQDNTPHQTHHEIDGVDFTPSLASSNRNASRPIVSSSLNPHRSYNSTPQLYQPYYPGAGSARTSVVSSIRQIQPSGSYGGCSHQTIYSPAAESYVVSPIVGGDRTVHSTTPLMDQWGSGDKASVGERTPQPAATVAGPVNWPSSEHIRSSNRPTSRQGSEQLGEQSVQRSLTSATGGDFKWISPESALQDGYSPDEHEGRLRRGEI
jgi:hypothetical protein